MDIEFNDPDTPGVLGISTHPIIRTNGTLGQLIDQNGTFYYYPNADAYGTDNLEIALELSDRNLTYPLEFVIAEVDDQPIANADTFAYEAGDSSAGILEVLSNDVFAPDVGETLFVERIISDGLRGIVSLDANASAPSQSPLQFTPEAGFIGDTSFSYVLSDGNLTDQTTVSLRVATSESLPGWRYTSESSDFIISPTQPKLDSAQSLGLALDRNWKNLPHPHGFGARNWDGFGRATNTSLISISFPMTCRNGFIGRQPPTRKNGCSLTILFLDKVEKLPVVAIKWREFGSSIASCKVP